MATIPFLGRLHPYEYLALVLSFLLSFLEIIARTVTLLLPTPIIRFLYRVSRRAFNSLSSPYSRRARNKKRSVTSPIAQAQDFVDLCELYGYYAEEHVVQTKDGYLLGVHRLGWRRGEEDQRVNGGPGTVQKKVVYLHHGLMMNSEVWVCLTEQERCLPFMLVEQGYDVWLGNNRGNKYSKKCMNFSPADSKFWNFSMDQFAFHDIPDTINYILTTTEQPSLSYIGFSQGTAQAFATLSIHPTLNNKVDLFVALAPAMAPPGLASGVVSSLVKSHPEMLFLLFGRRAILSSTTMWQALLYPAIFCWFIDKSLSFLFGWKAANIPPHQKLAAYPHLFSFTSTKSVVHWFQIIDKGKFQMYDDEVSAPVSLSSGSKYYKVAKFPTRNIKTPIVLIYGGSDSLVDIKLMLKELPRHTIAKCVPKYEHLDLLWAGDVDKLVFPHVLEALESYAKPNDTKLAALGWHPVQPRIPSPFANGQPPPGYSDREQDSTTVGRNSQILDFAAEDRRSITEEQMDETDYEDDVSVAESYQPNSPLPTPLTGESRSVRVASPSSLASGASTVKMAKEAEQNFSRRTITPSVSNPGGSLRRPGDETSSSSATKSWSDPVQMQLGLDYNKSSREPRVGPEGWWSSTSLSSAAATMHSSPTSSREPLTTARYPASSVPASANGNATSDLGETPWTQSEDYFMADTKGTTGASSNTASSSGRKKRQRKT